MRQVPLLSVLLCLLLFASGLQAQTVNIVYHLHQLTPRAFKRSINNLENLYKGLGEQSMDVHLILQGEGVKLLSRKLDANLHLRLLHLLQRGLIIEAEKGSYRSLQGQLDPEIPVRQIDNALSRLVTLQQKGYRYVTP